MRVTEVRSGMWALASALSVAMSPLAAQNTPTAPPASAGVVVLRDPGPSEPANVLRGALAAPYLRYDPRESGRARLQRDSSFDRTVIILGADATVASRVHGDVIVVDGDLFLHPGAEIDGRAIAIGGGVYSSTQATLRGGSLALLDAHYDIQTQGDSTLLRYDGLRMHVPFFTLARVYGLMMPQYNRVDGLVVGWGPVLQVNNGQFVLEPAVTYHSDLGDIDGRARFRARLLPRLLAEVTAERGTFSNDRWISPEWLNGISVLTRGRDYRNYWGAERFEGLLSTLLSNETSELTIGAGARTERAWSLVAGGPWSFTGRTGDDGVLRPNPAIEAGRISSAIAHARARWEADRIVMTAGAVLEVPFATPRDERFMQTTFDGSIGFETFRDQRLDTRIRAVISSGDSVPPQRFAYLGGAWTLPTFEVLGQGGDRLFYLSSDYSIPIPHLKIPLVGSPVLKLHYLIGAAGLGRLPAFEQDVGIGIGLPLFTVDFVMDPASKRTDVSLGIHLVP